MQKSDIPFYDDYEEEGNKISKMQKSDIPFYDDYEEDYKKNRSWWKEQKEKHPLVEEYDYEEEEED